MSLTYILHWILTSVIFQICDSYAINFVTLSMFMGCLYICFSYDVHEQKLTLSGVSACGTNTMEAYKHSYLQTSKSQYKCSALTCRLSFSFRH